MRDHQQPSQLSRRTLVAALAAASAAVAVPATAIAGPQPVDPIFALIDAHRLAHQRYLAAIDFREQLRASLPKDVVRPGRVDVGGVLRGRNYWYSHEQIKEHVRSSFVKSKMSDLPENLRQQWKDWNRKMHTELQVDIERQRRLHVEAGLTDAEDAFYDASEAEAAAIDAVYDATATTVAGLLAFIRYVVAHERIDDKDQSYQIASAVERALSGIVA
jgi:hypothetical protein